MVFSDLFFLFVFLPSFALMYLLAAWIDKKSGNRLKPSYTARNLALVVFSLIFYAWGEPVYVFLMLFCVLVNYLAGLGISLTRYPKAMLILGVAADIGILCIFKYLGFFSEILRSAGLDVADPGISLPIGVSFYIFQSISYLVDVYRREAPMQRNFMDLLVYVSMFPQLIAGPIVRYGTVAEEIHDRSVSARDFSEGSYRFLIGLAKKVIIANQLSEISDQFLKNGLDDLSTAGAWVGLLAFTFQIYFDFSGYSDMAIGMGRCLGFHFNENFNHPYCCNSITDFWRRWHMSLGSFFRDYVYIPLGGKRRHQSRNIMCVWFLTGMWHGASWNFIIWGVYFGVILMIEKHVILKAARHIPRIFMHLYAFAVVVVGWGIFYFDDFGRLSKFFRRAFALEGEPTDFFSQQAIFDNFWLWVLAVALCFPVRRAIDSLGQKIFRPETSTGGSVVFQLSRIIISILILAASVALLVGATNNAFIYTRF